MFCCPCFPTGKRKKVRPVPVPEGTLPRPKRVHSILKRLKRFFKKKGNSDESLTNQRDALDKVLQPQHEPEVPATTITPQFIEEEEEKEEVTAPSPSRTPKKIQKEVIQMKDLDRVKDTCSASPVLETLSSLLPVDRVAAQVVKQLGGRTSKSTCLAPASPKGQVILSQHVELKCRGLPNLGQTCYLNAVLQCLIHLQPLCTQLLQQENLWSNKPEALLLSTFASLLRVSGSSDMCDKSAVLLEFKERIALHNQEFKGNSQNDAHEFLSEILLRLGAIGQQLPMRDLAYQCPVDTLFSFQLRYIRTCQSCGVESSRDEVNTILSLYLDVQGSGIRDSLQLYFAETAVEFKCECCGRRGSTMRCHFLSLPQVLILHLKRFCPLTLTKQHQALRLDTSLHLSALDTSLEDHKTPPSSPTVSSVGEKTGEQILGAGSNYQLTSIVSHLGSNTTCGHYIADCEEQPGQWVTYNDKHVTLASEEATLKARRRTAYILFYIKR